MLPLGFFLKSKTLVVDEPVLVYPRLLSRASLSVRRGGGRRAPDALESSGREGDVTQLREFREGDDVRALHWKQTARQQTLVVVERQRAAEKAVYYVVDPRLEDPEDPIQRERFERLVSEAATGVVRRLREGIPVGLVVGGQVFRPVRTSRRAPAAVAAVGRGGAASSHSPGAARGRHRPQGGLCDFWKNGMTADQYRRLLGALMVWSIVPLPFLYIILPPFWLVAATVGLVLVMRPGLNIRFSDAVLNGLGLVILVIVLAVGGLRMGPLRPLGHLLLLLTAVRALAVTDRKSFFRGLLPVFLVWVVAVTSSTHITIIVYFSASAAVWWWAGMRILLSGTGIDLRRVGETLPRPRHAVAAAVAALVLAGPIFVIMPRLRAPWVAGRGGASSVTGFTSHVELGGMGTIRQSPEVAMVVRSVSGERLESRWMRLRGTALERVTLDSWAPRGATQVGEGAAGLVWPFGRRSSLDRTVELEIELVNPRRYLFVPEGTVALAAPVPVLLDPSGGVALESRPRGSLLYTVWVARDDGPVPTDPPPSTLRSFELDPEVRHLAQEMVAGHRTPAAMAEAVEDYLQENYAYSLRGMTSMRSDPVTWFLLTERQGHCEYFAGAMVAILSELGIPARIVAGYSGGSLAPDGESAVVREANAHTWVEARVGQGPEWTAFDPTPAAEVPALARATGRERVQWALQWAQSSWDRYLLTFGFGEQIQMLSAITSAIETAMRSLSWWMFGVGAVVVAIPVFLRRWLRGRPRSRRSRGAGMPAATVMEQVAARLHRAGVEVPPRATVRWIANRARSRWPAVGAVIGDLTWLAERELYAAATPQPANRAVVRKLWAQARRGMKQID